jgi:hypothetical protein
MPCHSTSRWLARRSKNRGPHEKADQCKQPHGSICLDRLPGIAIMPRVIIGTTDSRLRLQPAKAEKIQADHVPTPTCQGPIAACPRRPRPHMKGSLTPKRAKSRNLWAYRRGLPGARTATAPQPLPASKPAVRYSAHSPTAQPEKTNHGGFGDRTSH